MRYLPLLVSTFLTLGLLGQDDLPTRLARAQATRPDQLRDLQARLAASEASPEAKAYHASYLAYCMVNQIRGADPKGAEALLDRTMKELETRKDADSLALLGACIGLKLGFAPMSAMSLAPRASGLFEKALKLNPANPRALTMQGTHVLHTPAFFGGGAAKALPILEAAVKAADAEPEPKDAWQPRWGKVESRAWLAKAQGDLGQLDHAKATLAQAKQLDPDNGFLAFIGRSLEPKAK